MSVKSLSEELFIQSRILKEQYRSNRNTTDVIVGKRLRWHKTETILLWLIIGRFAPESTVILIPAGIGIYSYVGNLGIAEYVF